MSANCTFRDLATKLDVHGRHCMFSYLSSLPVSVLRSLDTFTIELTDYMMLLYLQGITLNFLFVQSLIPKKLYNTFYQNSFINKGMDFIDSPSIFRDKSVQSSIPNYFKNCEVPIVCYKYNSPIRGAIFNFNKLVSDLDIETCASVS